MSIRLLSRLDSVSAEAWDALHDGCNPFISHAFLAGLEAHGCLREQWGWTPRHLTLWDDDTLIAAAPGYLKDNSHGEFVFDHAWARAYAQYGREYYPKWLCAVPYSPVTGPRLLARDAAARRDLLAAIVTMTQDGGWSSAHVNFHGEDEDCVFDVTDDCPQTLSSSPRRRGSSASDVDTNDVKTLDPRLRGDDEQKGGRQKLDWLQRIDVQYHWRNDAGWRCFDDFLAAMNHKHRKNIRQERAKVARSGATFRVVHGDEASEDDLAAMHGFYLQTFADYGNSPALTLEFLRHLAQTLPRQLVLILADHEGEAIAGALCLRGGDTLYGRYWGAQRTLPGLHFETCYYQGIDYCLREGLTRFEPGAQGEHKIDRGFLPAFVRSRHWIADPDFAKPLARWCEEEAITVRRYAAQLAGHSPLRTPADDCG